MNQPRSELQESEFRIMLRTRSSGMQRVFEKINMVAQTQMTVLLTGETGTGKGIVARLIHENSPRQVKQFVSVHCGAIPEALVESELFGHEKGRVHRGDSSKTGKIRTRQRGDDLFG